MLQNELVNMAKI